MWICSELSHTIKRQKAPGQNPSYDVRVGDTMPYSGASLQSIGAYTGNMPHAKGQLTDSVLVGRDLLFAKVAWDRAELPARVNARNLCQVGSRGYPARPQVPRRGPKVDPVDSSEDHRGGPCPCGEEHF